jgi:hypothetical protein
VYGVIRQAEVDDILIPDGAVTEAINVHFDRKGATTSRLGVTAIGATVVAGYFNVGLFNVQSNTMIAAFDQAGSVRIYHLQPSNVWGSTLSGLTSSARVRFVDFAGRTVVVNGTYDSIRVWNGSNATGWVSTGNPINPQQFASDASVNTQTLRASFIEVYKSRVYLAGDATSPDRLFFSSVISSAGNLAWTPSTDYVDINPSDGENITGLKRFSLELLVFKPNYIYRFRTSGVDPDPLIKIGTRSQESVVEGKKGMYFHHDTGLYRYSGGYPKEISRPIIDFIDNIPYTKRSKIYGWRDQDHIYWSIGNITLPETSGNVTWSNVVLRFTENSEVWTVYSYSNDITGGVDFNNQTTLTRVVGLDNGVIATFNNGNTDLGEPIKYRVSTKWYEWSGIASRKVLLRMQAISEKAQGGQVHYQVDEDPAWKPIPGGQVKKFLNFFEPLSINFHRIRFKLTGVSRVEPAIFLGFEVALGLDEGIIKE